MEYFPIPAQLILKVLTKLTSPRNSPVFLLLVHYADQHVFSTSCQLLSGGVSAHQGEVALFALLAPLQTCAHEGSKVRGHTEPPSKKVKTMHRMVDSI